ncbi:hypothetical protein FHG87_009788 [Trinorchestia longiramus]|nr:hypothetical protein FHG87_009788 [Trinorchestia longiramus]
MKAAERDVTRPLPDAGAGGAVRTPGHTYTHLSGARYDFRRLEDEPEALDAGLLILGNLTNQLVTRCVLGQILVACCLKLLALHELAASCQKLSSAKIGYATIFSHDNKDCVRVRNPAMNTSYFSFHAVSSHLSVRPQLIAHGHIPGSSHGAHHHPYSKNVNLKNLKNQCTKCLCTVYLIGNKDCFLEGKTFFQFPSRHSTLSYRKRRPKQIDEWPTEERSMLLSCPRGDHGSRIGGGSASTSPH